MGAVAVPSHHPEENTVARNGFLSAIRTYWRSVLVCTVVGGLVGLVVFLVSPPVYTATDTLYIVSRAGRDDSATSAYNAGLLSQDRVKSYKELLEDGRVATAAADRLPDVSVAEIADNTEIANQPETVLLTVTVTDRSPERAALIANTYGDAFQQVVTGLERPSDPTQQSVVDVRTAFPAAPNYQAVSPRAAVDIPVGVILGLAAGALVAIVRRRRDDSLVESSDLAELVGSRDLGRVVTAPADAPGALLMVDRPHSPASEDYRRIGTTLRHTVPARRPVTIAVTSAEPGEGRSTTAVNLALVLAHTGDRVLLVDANLRGPAVGRLLGLSEEGPGLAGLLAGEVPAAEVVHGHGPCFDVVPAGSVPPNPGELLSSSLLPMTLDELTRSYDWVVLDTPALSTSADAATLAALCTGALVVCRSGVTSGGDVTRATDMLRAVGTTVLGSLLTEVPDLRPRRLGVLMPTSRPQLTTAPRPTPMTLPAVLALPAPAPVPAEPEQVADPEPPTETASAPGPTSDQDTVTIPEAREGSPRLDTLVGLSVRLAPRPSSPRYNGRPPRPRPVSTSDTSS